MRAFSDDDDDIIKVRLLDSATVGVSVVPGGPAGPPGAPGPPGPPGPQGPAGDTVAAISHRHVEAIPSASWVINHPLNFTPNVTVIDSTGETVEGAVDYTDEGVITVSFANAFSGEAYLS